MERFRSLLKQGKDERALTYAWIKMSQWIFLLVIYTAGLVMPVGRTLNFIAMGFGALYAAWRLVFWTKEVVMFALGGRGKNE